MGEMWPKYYPDVIELGDINSNVAVVCLWTERHTLTAALPMNKICAVGQLYSHNRGISALLRNILLNPVITDLVLCGIDKSGSGKALAAFFADGVNDDHQIIGIKGGNLDRELPRAALDELRTQVTLHNRRNIWQPAELITLVEERYAPRPAWAPPRDFPEPKREPPETLPSEKANFTLRGATMLSVWPRLLARILDFGTVKESQYNERQRELINVMVEINDDPLNPTLADWLPFSKEDLEDYYPQVLTGDELPGVNYTYGQKIFRWKDERLCINQIENIISQLKTTPHTRRAVAVTWSVVHDHNNEHAPCLDLIQALVQNESLYLIAYFRSNDMFKAWPRNALALRRLQGIIADRLGLGLGPLTTISASAHIYEGDFTDAQKIATGRGRQGTHVWNEAKQECIWTVSDNDPRGVMVITVEEGQIKVEQKDWQTGDSIRQFTGQSAIDIYSQIVAAEAISIISHALDIGCELQKAEHALLLGVPYRQDQPIPIIVKEVA